MGDRSHLRQAMTVDKNGHAKTVYVSPGDSGPSFSMLSSLPPSLPSHDDDEDGDSSEWDESGLSDPQSWQDNEFSLSDAYDWDGEDFDAETAWDWRNSGFDSGEAAEWKKAEFSAGDAAEWKEHADADAAVQWINDGFDVNDAQPWISAGYDSSDAKSWVDAGIDSADVASEWMNNNFDPAEAVEWMDAGFKEPFVAADWRGEASRVRNLNKEDLLTIMEAGHDAQDAPMWLSVLDTVHSHGEPNETMSSVLDTLNGVNPSAGEEYANYYPYSKWAMLSGYGIEYDQVAHVDKLRSAVANRDADEYGDDYEEDPDGELETAAMWVSQTQEISNGKAKVMENLILAGESIASCKPFLSSKARAQYDASDSCLARVRTARDWAKGLEGNEATTAFDALYAMLPEEGLDSFVEVVNRHGIQKVQSAVSHGLTTDAQIINYLEHSGNASISEGAL